jgi:hypothetical protein
MLSVITPARPPASSYPPINRIFNALTTGCAQLT